MREYLLTILVTAVATYVLVPPVRVFALKIGAAPPARDRDVHTAPIPLLGGLAMFGGMAAGLVVASRLPHLHSEVFSEPSVQVIPALLLAGGLIVFTGFVDDYWGMGPAVKFAGQVAAAGILVYYNVAISWIPLPAGEHAVLPPELSVLLTILLVVTMINGVNFVDGLDGLAAGIVAIGAFAMLWYGYALLNAISNVRLLPALVISAVLIGMCLGFLPHNFHPARIFMGDTGAMLLGLMLACSVITLTQIGQPLTKDINRFPTILPLLLPFGVMLIPLVDLTLAFFRRTWAGNSPFHPDRKHLHHRLLEIGHSHRRTVVILYLWAFVFASAIVIMSIIKSPLIVLVLTVLLAGGVMALMSRPHWLSSRTRAARKEARKEQEAAVRDEAAARDEPRATADPRSP